MREPLPEILPADPLPLVARWIEEAGPVVKSATAMALATVDADGSPTARMVICRGYDATEGWFVFYTDRASAKGQALESHPRAALVFHWDVFERQIRVEGPVTHALEADSDRYWNTRPLDARIAAVASEQSRPIASRAAFLEKIEVAKRTHGTEVARAPGHGSGLHRRAVAGDAPTALRRPETLETLTPGGSEGTEERDEILLLLIGEPDPQHEIEELHCVLEGEEAAVVQVRRRVLDPAQRKRLDRPIHCRHAPVERARREESLRAEIVHQVVGVVRRRVADGALPLAEEHRLAPLLFIGRLGGIQPPVEAQLGSGREIEELLHLRHEVHLAAPLEHV